MTLPFPSLTCFTELKPLMEKEQERHRVFSWGFCEIFCGACQPNRECVRLERSESDSADFVFFLGERTRESQKGGEHRAGTSIEPYGPQEIPFPGLLTPALLGAHDAPCFYV